MNPWKGLLPVALLLSMVECCSSKTITTKEGSRIEYSFSGESGIQFNPVKWFFQPSNECVNHNSGFNSIYCNVETKGCNTNDIFLDKKRNALILPNTTVSQQGFYHGIANDKGDIDMSFEEFCILIEVQPTTSDLRIDQSRLRFPMKLQCHVDRIKPPATSVHWIVDGQRLNGSVSLTTNADHTYRQDNFLVLRKEDATDEILCIVDSKYGNLSRTHPIMYKPVGAPVLSKTFDGKDVVLICDTRGVNPGNPKFSHYTWYKDGDVRPLTTYKSSEITFLNDDGNSGSYSCTLGNKIGESDRSNWIAVEARGPLGNPQIVKVPDYSCYEERTNINLTCDTTSLWLEKLHNYTYDWYIRNTIEIEQTLSSQLPLKITSLSVGRQYACAAANAFGTSNVSEWTNAITICGTKSIATGSEIGIVLGIIGLLVLILLCILCYCCKDRISPTIRQLYQRARQHE